MGGEAGFRTRKLLAAIAGRRFAAGLAQSRAGAISCPAPPHGPGHPSPWLGLIFLGLFRFAPQDNQRQQNDADHATNNPNH
jgi:hypothetical protein